MDKTLEARFLGTDNVLLDVRYYCCAYVVHVASVMIVCMQYRAYVVCVHVYEILCT